MTLELFGSNASPYSRKLRAILRYRRIAHVWKRCVPAMAPEFADVRPKLMPMLRDTDTGQHWLDSTPMAHALEQLHEGRSILPPNEGDRFICHLLEDMADEWVTKQMFHFRWIEDETAQQSAAWIVDDTLAGLAPAVRAGMISQIHDRQRSRMDLVGVGPANAAVIRADFTALLEALRPLAENGSWLFGSRPSLADFGLYGQLTQLVKDSLPRRQVLVEAPAVESWVTVLDDASGVDGEWAPESVLAGAARQALLQMAARSYLPFLVANAAALENGEAEFTVDIGGQPFRQAPFAYQAKCWREIVQRWNGLPESERRRLAPVLAGTGCLAFLTA